MEKDPFDLWWEWAEKPVDDMSTIPAVIHNASMALSPEERHDRATVNQAVRRNAAPETEGATKGRAT